MIERKGLSVVGLMAIAAVVAVGALLLGARSAMRVVVVPPATPTLVPFTVLAPWGTIREHSHDTDVIEVRTPAEWQRQWNRYGPYVTTAPPRVAPPSAVDFSKDMVVLVPGGEQSSGGFGVTVTPSRTRATGSRSRRKSSRRPPGSAVTAALTYPRCAVTIPRTDKKVNVVF